MARTEPTVSPDAAAREFLVAAGFPPQTPCELRRIGTDEAMVSLILERIGSGEKSMTFSLPWEAEHAGRASPESGDLLVALDAEGAPAALLRIERVETLRFDAVDEAVIAREGLAMRDPAAWRALHEQVWGARLTQLGLLETGQTVPEDMPVRAEYFELLHCAERFRGLDQAGR